MTRIGPDATFETGAKQSLGKGEIASLGNQLSFRPAAVSIVAAQAVLFGVIFQFSNRAVGSF